jgi:TolA-binding protein
MAILFLFLALLGVAALAVVGVENTSASSATLFDRSFSQLTEGQLLVLAAALGFLVALFLFLAFGASRTRRSRRKELRSRRRDAEGRVDELERENARLRQELTSTRGELEGAERADADARAGARAAVPGHERAGATAAEERSLAGDRGAAPPPQPASVRRERLDDRTSAPAAPDEHVRAAADEEARR